MNRIRYRRPVCILLCAALLWSTSACSARKSPQEDAASMPEASSTEEAAAEDAAVPSLEDVTAGIGLTVPRKLSVTRPSEDIDIDAENYYITGSSDPDITLLLNGEEVENRGMLGSFGVFAELSEGANTYSFTQDGSTETVTITRQADGEVYTTDIITRPSPAEDDVIRSGEAYTLRCTAPSGAAVTARVNGKTIDLEQRAATAVEGVPASFTAEFVPDGADVTENIGQVTYILNRQGKESEYLSAGSLFVAGNGSPLLVRAKDVSATVFTEESTESDYFATLKRGAVDIVTDIGADMYRLDMGGWVVKSSFEPLTETADTENRISEAIHTVSDKAEALLLKGSAAAPYRSEQTDGRLVITFLRTNGIDDIALKGSKLFTDVQVSQESGNTAIEFLLSEAEPLWGYLVEYVDGGILLTFKPAPELSQGAKPLRGVTVAVDPGHGGDDTGALGISRESGATEKDINLAAAKAARVYLEALGADVLMTRENDDTVDMNSRLEILQRPEVDFVISLHCNSIPYNSDGTRPSGTEIYYYEDSAAPLAEEVLRFVCERTGRDDRGARQANYKITLNSNAPSVMLEMGFMTNPREYDNLCDIQAIYETASSVADGIIATLS